MAIKDCFQEKKIITENEKIEIKKMDQSMAFDVWQNSLDEDNKTFVPDEVFETLADAKEVIAQIIESYENDNGPFIFAVVRKSDNANLGYVQLVSIDDGYEIGYHIAKKYTGNGYATESVNLFTDYLRKNTGLKEIIGIALSDNKASRRVLEKCGFQLTFDGDGLYQGKIRKIIKTMKAL